MEVVFFNVSCPCAISHSGGAHTHSNPRPRCMQSTTFVWRCCSLNSSFLPLHTSCWPPSALQMAACAGRPAASTRTSSCTRGACFHTDDQTPFWDVMHDMRGDAGQLLLRRQRHSVGCAGRCQRAAVDHQRLPGAGRSAGGPGHPLPRRPRLKSGGSALVAEQGVRTSCNNVVAHHWEAARPAARLHGAGRAAGAPGNPVPRRLMCMGSDSCRAAPSGGGVLALAAAGGEIGSSGSESARRRRLLSC